MVRSAAQVKGTPVPVTDTGGLTADIVALVMQIADPARCTVALKARIVVG